MTIRPVLARDHARPVTVRAGHATGERVRLSVYDLLTGTFATPRTFYYRRTLDAAALRDSLARTLVHYPLLAGRLKRDRDSGLSVLCDDSGALFAEVRSHCPMPEYGPDLSARPDLRGYLHSGNPFLVVGHDTPLLTVKVTHMRGGGSVLGVVINHSVVDGTGYLDFLRHWSREHRGLDHPPPPPPHTRVLLDALGSEAAPGAEKHSAQYARVRGREKFAFIWRVNARARQVRTLTVRFSSDEVRAVKEAATASPNGTGRGVSTGDALGAHLWKVLGELRGRPAGSAERLGVVISVRAALRAELPDGYWGNAVTNTTPALTAGDLRAASLADVASTVRAAVDQVTAERVREEIAFLAAQRAARRLPRVLSRMALDAFDGTVALNNVSRLPVYGVEFGGGRPFWFQYPASPIPWTLLVTPTPQDDSSRDVHLSVPREAAEALATPEWADRLHTYAPDH